MRATRRMRPKALNDFLCNGPHNGSRPPHSPKSWFVSLVVPDRFCALHIYPHLENSSLVQRPRLSSSSSFLSLSSKFVRFGNPPTQSSRCTLARCCHAVAVQRTESFRVPLIVLPTDGGTELPRELWRLWRRVWNTKRMGKSPGRQLFHDIVRTSGGSGHRRLADNKTKHDATAAT